MPSEVRREIEANAIVCCDVLDGLGSISDSSVHLIVTSCPFNVGIKYDNHYDQMPHVEYLAWMKKIWAECYRVLVPGGRICINIDATMNLHQNVLFPERVHPLHVDFTNQLRDIGYIYRGEICWCLAANTEICCLLNGLPNVTTLEKLLGYKGFQEIDVETIDELGYRGKCRITEWRESEQDVFRIVLSDGQRIDATADHRWRLIRNQDFQLDSEVKTADLRPGDLLPKLLESSYPTSHPSALYSQEVGWMIGLFLAEGSTGPGTMVHFALEIKDEDIIVPNILRIIRSLGAEPSVYRYGNDVHVNVYDPVIRAMIDKFVVGDSAKTKRLSRESFWYGTNFLRGVVHGFADGDLSHDKVQGRWTGATIRNRALSQSLRFACQFVGYRYRSSDGHIVVNGKRYNIIQHRIRYNLSKEKQSRRLGDCGAVSIKSIKLLGKRKCFDINVDSPTHLFVVGAGIVTHNCKQNAPGKDTAWGCYDDKTEVLTRSGMKPFCKVTQKDELATLNPTTLEVEYQHPLQLVKKMYSGSLKRIKTKAFDLLVTPDHNMVFWNDFKRQIELRPLSQMPKQFQIPKQTNGMRDAQDVAEFVVPPVESDCNDRASLSVRKKLNTPVAVDMDTWLAFLGIFLTDGHVYCKNRQYKVSVYQSKQATFGDVEKIISKMPFPFKFNKEKSEFYVYDKRLAKCLIAFGLKDSRTFPDFIPTLSVKQQRIFLDHLFMGDGHTAVHGKDYLAISSNEFVSKLCAVLVNCGYHFSVSKKQQKARGRLFRFNHPINIVRIHRGWHSHVRKSPIDEPYEGYVYCAEVQNHILFVGRNGKYTWCGNSYCLCSNPHIRRNSEYIILASKESLKLEGDPMMCDLTKEEFHEWTLSEWKIQPETANKGHPVPFPRELVKRCIKLFSYVGNVVLDPFNGSGTTTTTALELGRQYIGIDNSEKYCRIAKNAIKQVEAEFALSGGYRFTPSPVHVKEHQSKKSCGQVDLFD